MLVPGGRARDRDVRPRPLRRLLAQPPVPDDAARRPRALPRARRPRARARRRRLRAYGSNACRSATSMTREHALERIRGRHISTFQLIGDDEYRAGPRARRARAPGARRLRAGVAAGRGGADLEAASRCRRTCRSSPRWRRRRRPPTRPPIRRLRRSLPSENPSADPGLGAPLPSANPFVDPETGTPLPSENPVTVATTTSVARALTVLGPREAGEEQCGGQNGHDHGDAKSHAGLTS